jgi:hypothetical protein
MRVRYTNPQAAALYRKGVDLETAFYMSSDVSSNTVAQALTFLVEHKVIPVDVLLPGWEEVPGAEE